MYADIRGGIESAPSRRVANKSYHMRLVTMARCFRVGCLHVGSEEGLSDSLGNLWCKRSVIGQIRMMGKLINKNPLLHTLRTVRGRLKGHAVITSATKETDIHYTRSGR